MTESAKSEIALRHLIDAVGDYAIYMLDTEGKVLSWNQGAERLKGYSAVEIQHQNFSRFFTPEDRGAGVPAQLMAKAAQDGRVESEGWRVRKDGARFWALCTLSAIRDEDGGLKGYAKVSRDMTRQRAAQEALLESERRFRYLVDGVIDYAIYMLDVNGMITNWNRGAERMKGYAASEVIGRHFSTFYLPEDRQEGRPALALATALREGRYESEGWRVRKDGGRFWASAIIDAIRDDKGELIGFAKITRDISQRRAADKALADSERQFRLLVSGVTDYALYMLDPNGIVTNWNAGAQAIKGYGADEVVGQHFSRFYTEADRAAGRPAAALRTALEQGRYEAEGWRVRKDGSLFWASVIIDIIRDESGALVGFAKITRDITERRDAQMEMQRAQEQISQAQRMEALGQLTGGVAHDFNNLLMVVSGQSQMLRRMVGDDPRALRALDALTMAADRGKALTRHLLTFARRQRLEPRVMRLDEQLETLRELLQGGLPPGVDLQIDIPRGVWPVQVDPSEFELAMLNLTVNARDAMPTGGALAISARNVQSSGAGDPGIEGDFVAVSVTDTGSGIPPDILGRVFDPFFTTKDVSKGTGLGLSQVLGFAQQSGGQATVDSELGKGATVTLYLPRARAEAQHAERQIPASESGSVPRADILLVEDNPDVAEVAAGLLEQLGHRVRVSNSAAAALAALDGDWSPDLVFSDIVMAGELDGIGLARRLRAERPKVPVLLATGYSQTAESLSDEFPILRKPYSLADLDHAVNAALRACKLPALAP